MYNQNTSKWTDEIDDVMRRNWCEGTSATDCAKIIYAKFGVMFKRGAIIGRAKRKGYKTPSLKGYPFRLKDPGKPKAARPKEPTNTPKPVRKKTMRRTIAPWSGMQIVPIQPTQPHKGTPKSLNMTLLELPPRCCLYATSPDDAETHLFCGRPQQEGIPYCRHHARIAYRGTARQVENEGVRV